MVWQKEKVLHTARIHAQYGVGLWNTALLQQHLRVQALPTALVFPNDLLNKDAAFFCVNGTCQAHLPPLFGRERQRVHTREPAAAPCHVTRPCLLCPSRSSVAEDTEDPVQVRSTRRLPHSCPLQLAKITRQLHGPTSRVHYARARFVPNTNGQRAAVPCTPAYHTINLGSDEGPGI